MIEVGIPNLSTPAAIIDRIIIEKLKIEEFKAKGQTELISTTEYVVNRLRTQLNLIIQSYPIIHFSEFFDLYNELIIALTIAVGQVSYFENQKAIEHKRGNEKDTAYIAHMDLLSRSYNEKRSLYKKQIDILFKEYCKIASDTETRTF